jgi:glucan phosphoethanolaminetransferase (alkaline phosphatase superfamily)
MYQFLRNSKFHYVCYFLALVSPNFFGRWSNQGMAFFSNFDWNLLLFTKLFYILVLNYILAVSLYLFFALVKSRWVVFPLTFIVGTLVTTEVAYRATSQMVTDVNFWALTFQTTAYEKWTYLYAYTLPLITALLLLLFLAWRFASFNQHSRPAWRPFRWFLYVQIFLLILVSSTGFDYEFKEKQLSDMGVLSNDFFETMSYLFPYNMVYSLNKYREERHYIAQFQVLRLKTPHAVRQTFTGPEIVIVVIGESSTSSHWQLSGYARPTNPRLSQLKDLVYFAKAYSLASFTRASVPMLLRLYTNDQLNVVYSDPTLVSAFADLGYGTHWYSMQPGGGRYDDTVHMVAGDSQELDYLAKSSFYGRSEFDEMLVQRLPDFHSISNKNLFVLHTLGSHASYHHRYPANFNKFTPTLAPDDPGDMLRPSAVELAKMLNGYDNSILYTDSVLSDLIELLQNSGKPVLLAYTSDHGQGLGAPGCNMVGHASSCRSGFYVPMFFWANPQYIRAHPQQWEQLRANSHSEVSAISFSMTVLDLAGGSYAQRLSPYLLTLPVDTRLSLPAVQGTATVDLRSLAF